MARLPVQVLFGLALPALCLGAQPGAAQVEPFGRWQQPLRRCALVPQGAPAQRCLAVQLDQRTAEVVRLTLQVDGPGRGQQMQLILVGALAGGSEPMACAAGGCSLRKPLQLQLISLSQARLDGRGLAQTLPHTLPVQGTCRITPADLHCEVMDRSGTSLSAAPTWRVDAQMN
jgi:hypothetical protein